MGFLSFFKVKSKVKLEDEFFGILQHEVFKKPSVHNSFHGSRLFQNNLTHFIIATQENLPTKKQKLFFEKIESEYESIKDNIVIPFLLEEYDPEFMKPLTDDFNNDFTLETIIINEIMGSKNEWELCYDSKEAQHLITIHFNGMIPQFATMDG